MISLPSKTFLLGEYSVLNRGCGLVANTAPCFELTITDSETTDHGTIHPDSPAGKFITEHKKTFDNTIISYHDPHQGLGGLGASTAQFTAVYRYAQPQFDPSNHTDLQHLHQCYSRLASCNGSTPSGADLLSQQFAGLCWIDCTAITVTPVNWSFDDIGFLLLRTGHKLATHEHLQNLPSEQYAGLATPTWHAMQALLCQDSDAFCQAVRDFFQHLQHFQLVAATTLSLCEQLQTCTGIKAIKGCGAMGADIILAVYKLSDESQLISEIDALQLPIVASHRELTRYNG